MALIQCPECGKSISDKAASCPNCGCPIHVSPVPAAESIPVTNTVNYTSVGEFKTNKPAGIGLIILGVFLIIFSIPFAFVLFLGIFGVVFGFLCIVYGTMLLKGQADCTCPYCGSSHKISKNTYSFKCPSCKKTSVYDEVKHQLRSV